jgi:hypothetical protein
MLALLRIDQVVNTAIDHEIARAKLKFGACYPHLIALESSSDTMDNRQLLRALRFLNQTGSPFRRRGLPTSATQSRTTSRQSSGLCYQDYAHRRVERTDGA